MKNSKLFLYVCCCAFLILVVGMFAILPGQAHAAPEKDTDGFYMIKTADDLAWLRDGVNDGIIVSSDANAKLMNDIDLAGVGSWVPIGLHIDTEYSAVFDGRGYTIRNLSINIDDTLNISNAVGLFGRTSYATIRHVRIADAVLNVKHPALGAMGSSYTGILVGLAHTYTTIENCAVVNSSLLHDGTGSPVGAMHNAGAIAGFVLSDGAQLRNNTVDRCVIENVINGNGYAQSGGITAGLSGARATIKNCLVSNSTITCEISAPNDNDHAPFAGGITGRNQETIENCVSENNIITAESSRAAYVGGIAGYQLLDAAFIRNCTVAGAQSSITRNAPNGAFGYFVGESFLAKKGVENCFAEAGTSSNDKFIGSVVGPASVIAQSYDLSVTPANQLPIATVLLDDVMKIVEEGKSVNLSVVTYPGTNSDVTYAWNQDDSNVSLSAAAGDSIGVTGVTADETDYVACVPTPQAVVLSVTDLRCAFRVDAASDPHVPDPPAEPCEGDCGSGCSALPFEWLSVILIPSAAYLLATRKRRA